MKKRAFPLLALLAIAAVCPSASAQPSTSPETQALIDQGIAKFDKSDFEGALALFKQAYAKNPAPKILLDIALAEINGGHPLDALVHMKQFVRDPTADKGKVDAVNKNLIPKAWQQTGHIAITAPAGTPIAVDGQALPQAAPLAEPVDVMPGKHAVRFGGADGTTMDVDAPAGATTPLTFTPPTPPPSKVESARPPPPAPAPARDMTTSSGTFWTTNHVVAVGLGAGALIAGGLGVYFSIQSGNDGDKATSLRATLPSSSSCAGSTSQTCTDLKSAVDSQNSERTISTISFVAGGILAAGAIATLLFWPSPKSTERSATVVPFIAPGGSGAVLRASF